MQQNTLGKYAIKQGFDGYLRYDPTSILYSLVNSVKTLDAKKTNTGSILDFTNSLSGVTSNIASLFGIVSTLQYQIGSLSGNTTIINNYTNLAQTSSGTTPPIQSMLTSEDQGVLDAIMSTIDTLTVQLKTTFSEIVIFMKSVIFHSTVTFEDRVTFKDRDMAGTAIIQKGATSVYINFTTPYATIPKITVTADSFVTYRVTGKGTNGFTIETQTPVTADTAFDWIALSVV